MPVLQLLGESPLPVDAPREPSGWTHSTMWLAPALRPSAASQAMVRSSFQKPMSVGKIVAEQVTGSGLFSEGPFGSLHARRVENFQPRHW